MKQRTQIALFATFLSILAHYYLTSHYYPLKYGFSTGESICNLSAKFDCDAVTASSYSALLGIPLSVWGLAFNAVLFLLILMSWLEWSDYPERLRRWTFALISLSLGSSVVMAAISVIFLKSYCPVCIGLYVLSLITFFAYRGVPREAVATGMKSDLPVLWSQSRGILFSILAIPILAYFLHQMHLSNSTGGSAAEINRVVKSSLIEWEAAAPHEFVAKPSLVMGPDTAPMKIVEFADFRCGHCKTASYSIHAFMKANPDVRFEFYSYPLDGACNDKFKESTGLSCRLASATYCAEKEGKGWDMHRLLFEKQGEMLNVSTVANLDIELTKHITPLGLNWDSLQRCMNSPETTEAIRSQAKQGNMVNVRGTPALFANGKLLSRGMMVPVLQAVHERTSAGNRETKTQ